jgi:hypothetical protein
MAESATLAYYTVFSLAPVLLVVVAIAGTVFGPDAVRGRIVHQFGRLMGEEQAEMVQTILQKTQQEKASGPAAVVGIVTLLFGATVVFAQLQSSLDRIWERLVHRAPRRGVHPRLRETAREARHPAGSRRRAPPQEAGSLTGYGNLSPLLALDAGRGSAEALPPEEDP